MAVCYDHQGKFLCAIRYFDLCVQIEPTMDQAHIGSAICNMKIGRYTLALEHAQKAISHLEAHINKDRMMRQMYSLKEPIWARSNSTSKEAMLADAIYLSALLFRLLRRYSDAEKSYKQFKRFS